MSWNLRFLFIFLANTFIWEVNANDPFDSKVNSQVNSQGTESAENSPACQSCINDCRQKFGENSPICSTYCSIPCTKLTSIAPIQLHKPNLPTQAPVEPIFASPPPVVSVPPPTMTSVPPATENGECPSNWQNRGGKCYDPTGSPCNGLSFSGLTSEQKNAAAIYCGISNWADTNPCPDGWAFDSDTGQCTAPGILPCSPVKFYGNVSYKTMPAIQEWAKNCAAPWVGVNYPKGQPPVEMSSPQCPDGWSPQVDGSCKLISTSPQTTCTTFNPAANGSSSVKDQQFNWATMCGWPWAKYGFPFPCPLGFNKISGPESYNGCMRQGPVPAGVNMASKYFSMTNGCKQLNVNGWNMKGISQLAKDCKLQWPGINMPDPRYPNKPLPITTETPWP